MYYTTNQEILKLRKSYDEIGIYEFIENVNSSKLSMDGIIGENNFNNKVMLGGTSLYNHLVYSKLNSTSVGIDYDVNYPLSSGGSRWILKDNINYLKKHMDERDSFEKVFNIDTYRMLNGYSFPLNNKTLIKSLISKIMAKYVHAKDLITEIEDNFISYAEHEILLSKDINVHTKLIIEEKLW